MTHRWAIHSSCRPADPKKGDQRRENVSPKAKRENQPATNRPCPHLAATPYLLAVCRKGASALKGDGGKLDGATTTRTRASGANTLTGMATPRKETKKRRQETG